MMIFWIFVIVVSLGYEKRMLELRVVNVSIFL